MSDKAFESFIESFVDKPTLLEISPSKAQTDAWKVNFNSKKIPIGATGVYHPFTDKKQKFVMQGLTGCTAIFVVVSITEPTHELMASDLIVVVARHLGWPSVGGGNHRQWTRRFQRQIW